MKRAGFRHEESLHCPPGLCPESFARELVFWRLPYSALAPCCAPRIEPLLRRYSLLAPAPAAPPPARLLAPDAAVPVADEEMPVTENGRLVGSPRLLRRDTDPKPKPLLKPADPEAPLDDEPKPDEFLGNFPVHRTLYQIRSSLLCPLTSGKCCARPRRIGWDFMEDPGSSKPAKIFSLISVGIVLLSVLDLIIGSLPEFQAIHLLPLLMVA